jgi:hypothetical protein
MLMDAERAQVVGRRLYRLNTAIHSDVPQFDFSASTATDELSLSATLQVDISDPLLVFLPDLYHSSRRLLALVVHTNGTVSKARNKYVSFNLIRSQGGDARPGSRGDIL